MRDKTNRFAAGTVCFVLLFSMPVFLSGCFKKSNKYRGDGYVVTVPGGWYKGEPIQKPFLSISDEKPKIVTFTTPKMKYKFQEPDAQISIYTQKFEKPLWVEDITGDILQAIKQQGYTILGSGKINYDDSVGFSVNYRHDSTRMVFLDFYFATEGRVFLIINYTVPEKDFKKYIPDFETFRNSLEFVFSIF